MGIVEEVGSEVKKLRPGQRVVVSACIACGMCDYCKREEYTSCDTTNPNATIEEQLGHRPAALYGFSHLTGGVPGKSTHFHHYHLPGGQAEYVRVAFADINCLPVPDSIPDEKALYLTDIIPTAYHGCVLGEVEKGKSVGIWGLGPIGLMTARWCQILGAKRVIGIDTVPARLDMARSVLHIDTINAKEENVVERINQLAGGHLDVAIECAGFDYAQSWAQKAQIALGKLEKIYYAYVTGLETDTAEIFDEMFKAVRKFGNVSIIGVYTGYANHFPVGAMMQKNLIVKAGCCSMQKYWKYCLEKLVSGEIDPTFVITDRGHLSDAPKLYEKFNKKCDGCVKVFLRPGLS